MDSAIERLKTWALAVAVLALFAGLIVALGRLGDVLETCAEAIADRLHRRVVQIAVIGSAVSVVAAMISLYSYGDEERDHIHSRADIITTEHAGSNRGKARVFDEPFDYEASLESMRAEGAAHRAKLGERDVQDDTGGDQDDPETAAPVDNHQGKLRFLRRFAWEAPTETRARLWNIPEEDHDEATATAFLRVCISEADGAQLDCIGIWQVIKNIRRRSCERDHVRRITECEEGGGETYLSVMRRASKSVLGIVPPRSRRSRWVSELELTCEQPPSWPGTAEEWERQYGVRCPRTAEMARYLVKGELPPARPGQDRLHWLPGRPITWGGRCEHENGACDDPIACSRGLARIEGLHTANAFWCQPGSPGCRQDADPICAQLGYGHLVVGEEDEGGGEGAGDSAEGADEAVEQPAISRADEGLIDDVPTSG